MHHSKSQEIFLKFDNKSGYTYPSHQLIYIVYKRSYIFRQLNNIRAILSMGYLLSLMANSWSANSSSASLPWRSTRMLVCKCLTTTWSLFVKGASSTSVALSFLDYPTQCSAFLILQIGMSMAYKFKGILKVLCKVLPPVNNVVEILPDTVANATYLTFWLKLC